MNLEVVETAAGDLHVDRAGGERGSKGPFLHTYADDDGEVRWGYLCSNCETVNNAMDSMGRIECNECGNIRKPDEWDAVHE
ncbi:GNAT family acetyltransferase [Halobacteriales archaeon QS_6_71_20]|nr:MAG: GNAT family acetyltransferase [Halobacteriales archaeon QS_6_71_20]